MLLFNLRQGFPNFSVSLSLGLGLGTCVFKVSHVILVWGLLV